MKLKSQPCYLEMNPVNGITDILEHALVGHEEVAVFEAGVAADGKEQRDTQPSDRPRFYRMFLKTFFACLLLYGIAFPCWRGPQPNRKAISP